MKKLNWKFILPPPMLALFLFAACNLIQEMPQDFVETYGNIAYVEKVEYVNLAEENVGTPKVTETKNFKIIYHIKNDGDFDLSPEFSFEGCEIENPIVSTEKKRVTLTVAGESLKTLKDGAEFKVRLTLYKATQKVLQSAYEIDMRYVYTGGPEIPKGTVEIKIPLNLPDGYTLEVKDPENYFTYDKDKGIVTTIGSGVPEGKYELELVVKDEKGNVIDEIKKTIEVSAEKPTTGFNEKPGEKPLKEIINEIEDKIKEIEENKKNPETSLGKVEINIPVSGGYTLDIDGEDKDKFEVVDNGNGTFTIKQKGGGIPEKEYELTIIVKDEDENKVKQFEKTINVSAEKPADSFCDADEPFKITTEMIEKNTVYVRGIGGWYDDKHPNDAGASDDDNSGARLEPFATIQRAINEVITRNAASEDADEYTICVDGTLTQSVAAPMATFSALKKELTLTIKALSGTATLDGGARFDENDTVKEGEEGSKNRIINAGHVTNGILNLTIENMVIKGGNAYSGGGIYISNSTLKMKDCTIEGNAATDGLEAGGGIYVSSGTLTMERCTISGNVATRGGMGGGAYVKSGTLKTEKCVFSGNIAKSRIGGAIYISTNAEATMTDDEIKGNKATLGGGIEVSGGTLEMKNCKVEGNIATASSSGGIYVGSGGTVIMDGGTISKNKVEGNSNNKNNGSGVSVVHSTSRFTMKGDAIISGNILANATDRCGGEVCVSGGTFEMKGGTISGGDAKYGGGVYVKDKGKFKMTDGKIINNIASQDGGGIYVTGSESTFTMSGGTIGGENTNVANTAQNGGGVYVADSSTFTMTAGEIIGNKAIDGSAQYHGQGGGVYVNSAEFEISGEAKISENTATVSGGGIHIFKDNDKNATLTMTGGEICGNTAINNGGGGVYNQNGTFTMSGGTISGNKITGSGDGKGAYISSTFNMSGKARFSKDNDVYLVNLNKIHIGKLETESPVVATITPYKYQTNRQVLSADDETTMQDNYNKFAVTPEANGTNWKIVPYESDKKSGVLKKDDVQTGGIPVELPDFGETYTIVIMFNGNPIVENSEIISGNDITLVSVTDPKGTKVDGTVTIEFKDEGGTTILKSNDSNSKTLHVPRYSFEMQAQVYVKVELSNPTRVITKIIPVTIKPNSTP